MHAHPLRGPLLMVLATGSYAINDTLMKLATEALPPYQTLMLRGVAALAWGMPLLFALGYGSRLAQMVEPRVLARNLAETAAILCFVVALANMPIADATALGQITPLIVLIGAALFFGERLSGLSMALILVGFAGAVMVAQPSGAGLSVFALLALGNAVFAAVRDLLSRRVDTAMPGMIVAMSAVAVVFVFATGAHFVAETWVAPGTRPLLLLLGSGFFLIFGHLFIFLAYRSGSAGTVAPFFYSFSGWSMLSGLLVFGQFPNALALWGILLIVSSGLAVVWQSERRRKLTPTA